MKVSYLRYSLNNYKMKKYSKLNDILKYYEKNEKQIQEKYENYVYDLKNPRLDCECDTSKLEPSHFICYALFQYSYDTYFKSFVKKGKGEYPTIELMRWVRINIKDLQEEFWNGTLNYQPIDMLKFILNEYEMKDKLNIFIETI